MPLRDYTSRTTYENETSPRLLNRNAYRRCWYSILEALGIQSGQTVMIIGTGLGFDAAICTEFGCITHATDIVDLRDLSEQDRFTFHLRDISIRRDQNQLPNVDWAISSFMLPILSDGEAIAVDDGMHAKATNVAHYTPTGEGAVRVDPTMNWKTLSEWKALLPNSTLIRTIRPIQNGARLSTEIV